MVRTTSRFAPAYCSSRPTQFPLIVFRAGQTGTGRDGQVDAPTRVGFDPDPSVRISCLAASSFHTAACDDSGRLWTWGCVCVLLRECVCTRACIRKCDVDGGGEGLARTKNFILTSADLGDMVSWATVLACREGRSSSMSSLSLDLDV